MASPCTAIGGNTPVLTPNNDPVPTSNGQCDLGPLMEHRVSGSSSPYFAPSPYSPFSPSNGRFYSLQPPPPGPATQGGSLAARGPPQGRSGSRAPAHPCAAGRGGQDEVTSPHPQGGGGVGGVVPAAGAQVRKRGDGALVGADFAKNSCFCPATREGGRQERCRILKARRPAA